MQTAEKRRETQSKYRAANAEAARERDRSRVYAGRKKQPGPRDPLKIAAKDKVRAAIKSGKLVRPAECGDCNTPGPVQAHHEDYSKPLEVRWVCRACHGRRHRKYQ